MNWSKLGWLKDNRPSFRERSDSPDNSKRIRATTVSRKMRFHFVRAHTCDINSDRCAFKIRPRFLLTCAISLRRLYRKEMWARITTHCKPVDTHTRTKDDPLSLNAATPNAFVCIRLGAIRDENKNTQGTPQVVATQLRTSDLRRELSQRRFEIRSKCLGDFSHDFDIFLFKY